MPGKGIALNYFVFLFLASFSFAENKFVLFDFGNEEALKSARTGADAEKDPYVFLCENSVSPASGKKALKLVPREGAKWLVFTKVPKDWSAYDKLKMDIYNPTKKGLTVTLALSDWQALPLPGEYACLGYPMHQSSRLLKPGQHTLEFSVKKLATIDSRPISSDDIRLMAIGIDDDKNNFWIENIRLEKEEEKEE